MFQGMDGPLPSKSKVHQIHFPLETLQKKRFQSPFVLASLSFPLFKVSWMTLLDPKLTFRVVFWCCTGVTIDIGWNLSERLVKGFQQFSFSSNFPAITGMAQFQVEYFSKNCSINSIAESSWVPWLIFVINKIIAMPGNSPYIDPKIPFPTI